jgi:hypothetical protein
MKIALFVGASEGVIRMANNLKALRTYFGAEWRQMANAWPITVIAVGVIMSFAWAVLAVWVVLSFIDMAT